MTFLSLEAKPKMMYYMLHHWGMYLYWAEYGHIHEEMNVEYIEHPGDDLVGLYINDFASQSEICVVGCFAARGKHLYLTTDAMWRLCIYRLFHIHRTVINVW